MAKKIIVKISDNPETGTPRVAVFEGIQYLFYSMESAELVWLEYPARLNDKGEWRPIMKSIIQPRKIITPISNANKVTVQGITITPDYIKSITPINAGEKEEKYQLRLNTALELALSTGILEFDFWIKAIKWDAIIEQGGAMLESLKRFDRI